MALLALGSIGIHSMRAQQTTSNSSPSTVTTNWVGCLVTGRIDTADQITPSAAPTVIRQVEIGLRSDGVVVWRDASKPK